MTPASIPSGCAFGQHMVNQGPKYEGCACKKKRRSNGNQVIAKSGIIRPDKRHKVRYL